MNFFHIIYYSESTENDINCRCKKLLDLTFVYPEMHIPTAFGCKRPKKGSWQLKFKKKKNRVLKHQNDFPPLAYFHESP